MRAAHHAPLLCAAEPSSSDARRTPRPTALRCLARVRAKPRALRTRAQIHRIPPPRRASHCPWRGVQLKSRLPQERMAPCALSQLARPERRRPIAAPSPPHRRYSALCSVGIFAGMPVLLAPAAADIFGGRYSGEIYRRLWLTVCPSRAWGPDWHHICSHRRLTPPASHRRLAPLASRRHLVPPSYLRPPLPCTRPRALRCPSPTFSVPHSSPRCPGGWTPTRRTPDQSPPQLNPNRGPDNEPQ